MEMEMELCRIELPPPTCRVGLSRCADPHEEERKNKQLELHFHRPSLALGSHQLERNVLGLCRDSRTGLDWTGLASNRNIAASPPVSGSSLRIYAIGRGDPGEFGISLAITCIPYYINVYVYITCDDVWIQLMATCYTPE